MQRKFQQNSIPIYDTIQHLFMSTLQKADIV